MAVSIENTCLLLRHHPNGGSFGDPYDFVATLIILPDNKAVIKGAMGIFTKEIYVEVEEALRSIGITQVEYERYKDDGKHIKRNKT